LRVFVDTSVWIDYFRGRDRAIVRELGVLLDQDEVALAVPVRIELLAGVRATEAPRLRRLLGAVPIRHPTRETWDRVEDWALRSTAVGQRFGVGDLLIGAIADEHGGVVWSLDADFARMADLRLIRLHRPSA
jgi:predicted nucleic acid-binding protein